MSDTTRVVIVDDHPLFRDALELHLERSGTVEVVASVGTIAACLQVLADEKVDVVISDLHLPDALGTSLPAQTDLPVLLMTADDRPGTSVSATQSGAAGLLAKAHATGPALLLALDTVRSGKTCFPAAGSSVMLLTRRERDVLGHISQGLTTGQVAEVLALSPDTVRTYVDRIFRKLQVRSRAEAVTRATELGELLA